jgi:hypothetical protein
LILALGILLASCAHPPCQCVCAPAADPRVRDLEHEVDRAWAENERLRMRIRAEHEADQERAPEWHGPKIVPEGKP